MAPKICIVGAGISGLVLGRCLLHRGIQATVFEKSRPSQNRNRYGITLHSASYLPLLQFLGIEEGKFLKTVAVDCVAGGTGQLGQTADGNLFRANRSRFESLLADGLDIQYEHQLEVVSPSSGLLMKFTNGAHHKTDVLVGADGVHSSVRQYVSPKTDFTILPYAVYNGKRRLSRESFNSKLKEFLQGGNALEQKINHSVFQISADDYGKEQVNISYNYSRPAKSGQDPLYRPTRSKTDAKEIPPAFFDEINGQQLGRPYSDIFHSSTMEEDRILNWLMRTLQVERHDLDDAAGKNIVLIGEAAHAEPILGGYGANEAIQDGMKLAEMLAREHNLVDFYDSRFSDWTAGIQASEQRIEHMHGNSRSSL